MADENVPPGFIPLLITGPTQAIIECIIDEHVTEEVPYKLVPKQTIMNDIQKRAAVSDFSPFKTEIAGSNMEEILVVCDMDFLYGQNFFLIITEKAKMKYLWPDGPPADPNALPTTGAAAEAEEVEEIFVYKPPSPRPWLSHGSEFEVEEAEVKDKRRRIKLFCSRKRKYFNSPISFGDSEPEFESIKSIADAVDPTKRLQHDTSTQSVVNLTSKLSQTNRPEGLRNQWVQGEAREYPTEKLNELINSEQIKNELKVMEPLINLCLQQNYLYNAFENCWQSLGNIEDGFGSKSDGHLREYQSFTDLKFSKDKRLTCIEWHPTIKGIIAVSCAQRVSLYDRIDNAPKLLLSPSVILIWSFTDPIHPCLLLQAPTDVYSFQICPTNPDIIVGGCINGQVVLWNIKDYHERLIQTNEKKQKKKQSLFGEEQGPETPIIMWKAVTAIEHGHKAPISQIQWLPRGIEITKFGQTITNNEENCVQILTAASDTSFAVWDIRPPPPKTSAVHMKKKDQNVTEPLVLNPYAHLNLVWKPILKANLMSADSSHSHNPTRISLPIYTGDEPKTTFICGTEQGDVLFSSTKLVKDGDSGKLVAPRPMWESNAHAGPITSVVRSPFFNDVLLTVGGWSFAIWKESDDIDVASQPLLHISSNEKKYTAGAWSPTRPSIVFVGTNEGNVEVWDMLEKTHEASVVQNISTARITQLTPWIVTVKTNLIAVTDNVGTLHILEIPWNFRCPTPNEVQTVQGYISREVSRIKFFNDRKANGQEELTKNVTEQDLSEVLTDDDLENDYKEYLKLEQQLMLKLGLEAS